MSSPPKDVTFPPPAPADPETPRRPSLDPVPTTLSNPSPGVGIFNPNKSPALKAFFTLQAHRLRTPYIFDRAAGDTLIGAGQYEGQAAKEGEWRCTLKVLQGIKEKDRFISLRPGEDVEVDVMVVSAASAAGGRGPEVWKRKVVRRDGVRVCDVLRAIEEVVGGSLEGIGECEVVLTIPGADLGEKAAEEREKRDARIRKIELRADGPIEQGAEPSAGEMQSYFLKLTTNVMKISSGGAFGILNDPKTNPADPKLSPDPSHKWLQLTAEEKKTPSIPSPEVAGPDPNIQSTADLEDKEVAKSEEHKWPDPDGPIYRMLRFYTDRGEITEKAYHEAHPEEEKIEHEEAGEEGTEQAHEEASDKDIPG